MNDVSLRLRALTSFRKKLAEADVMSDHLGFGRTITARRTVVKIGFRVPRIKEKLMIAWLIDARA
jgi:hypothetical protein